MKRVSDLVFHGLRREILRGSHPPGSKLPPERELAGRFKVSRTTVREAVGRLCQLGLAETMPQSGTYVADFTADASLDLLVHVLQDTDSVDAELLRSLLEFRRVVELEAARKAARRADVSDIAAMRSAAEAQLAAADDPVKASLYDFLLHRVLIRAAGNLITLLIFNSIRPLYLRIAPFYFQRAAAVHALAVAHRKLISAVETGDAEGAAAIMDGLLQYGELEILGHLDREDGASNDSITQILNQAAGHRQDD